MVPESELLEPSRPTSPSSKSKAASTASAEQKETKRKGKPDAARAAKKKRTGAGVVGDDLSFVSPTLLTWVVSAGVVVLVSVVGFSAGYAMGREVGRQEMEASMTVFDGGSCGKDVVRSTAGLRRFRLGVAV